MIKWLANYILRKLVAKERARQKDLGFSHLHDRSKGNVHLYHQAYLQFVVKENPIQALALLKAASEIGDAWHVGTDTRKRNGRR